MEKNLEKLRETRVRSVHYKYYRCLVSSPTNGKIAPEINSFGLKKD